MRTQSVVHIVGKGGFSREVATYLGAQNIRADMVLSSEAEKPKFYTVCIGDPVVRKRICMELIRGGMFDTSVYCFSRYAFDYSAGYGTIICPGAVLTTNVKLGRCVIVNLNCTIGHDSTIGDFCTLSPGVHVSGNVKIGNGCYIGSGVAIRDGVTICDNVTIGCGAVVVGDIINPGVYVGVPALPK